MFTGHGQNDAGGHFHHETLGQLRHVNEPVLIQRAFLVSDAFMQREHLDRSPFIELTIKCQLETNMAETSKSTIKEKAAKPKNESHKEQEKLLNRELEGSFPASDPP